MKNIVFNGLAYGQIPTGIYRYANEILMELDQLINPGEYKLVVPVYAQNIPDFKNIEVIYYGSVKGILWEQTSLLRYLIKNKAISINFTNSMPLLKPGVIVIHDIGYKMNPHFYKGIHGKLAMWWHRLNYFLASICKIPVITVTEYSKKSIEKYYHVNADKITVIGNAWQHIERVTEQEGALEKFGLQDKKYYFSLGSLSVRKNTAWIYEMARRNQQDIFVIAGAAAKNSRLTPKSLPENVRQTGYITDPEMKSLMRHCKAFLFPSLYEGFGIPPLEAMSVGAPVIVSNASCLPEIYEDAAAYINPNDCEISLGQLKAKGIPDKILEKYSWRVSAMRMIDFMKNIEER